jgi:hypothetical protein
MPDDRPAEYSHEQLLEKLTEALETWPLYRELTYGGPAVNTLKLPGHIHLHCRSCGTTQKFTSKADQAVNHRVGFSRQNYVCRCHHSQIRFCFHWNLGPDKLAHFIKFGQYPPLDDQINPALEKTLDEEDVKLYRNAIRLRNFNMGIGAVAYMRRVVENRMNDILDVVHEVATQVQPDDKESLARFEEVKNDIRFAPKVEYAAAIMPKHLLPAGSPNPIGVLHSLTSDGLHFRSEEECVDTFDSCKLSFEYLFANFRPSVQEAKAFHRSLAELTKKQAARKTAKDSAKKPMTDKTESKATT